MVYLPTFTIKINHSCRFRYPSPMDGMGIKPLQIFGSEPHAPPRCRPWSTTFGAVAGLNSRSTTDIDSWIEGWKSLIQHFCEMNFLIGKLRNIHYNPSPTKKSDQSHWTWIIFLKWIPEFPIYKSQIITDLEVPEFFPWKGRGFTSKKSIASSPRFETLEISTM